MLPILFFLLFLIVLPSFAKIVYYLYRPADFLEEYEYMDKFPIVEYRPIDG